MSSPPLQHCGGVGFILDLSMEGQAADAALTPAPSPGGSQGQSHSCHMLPSPTSPLPCLHLPLQPLPPPSLGVFNSKGGRGRGC